MKGKHNIKAWASLALSTVMVAAMLPLTVFAEDPVTKPDENKYGGIMNPSQPHEFSNTLPDPYGYGVGTPFLLSEENELLFLSSENGGSGNNSAYENFNMGTGKVINSMSSLGNKTGPEKLNFVQAVAFDMTESGRKDHVAYLGTSGSDVYISIVDPVNGRRYSKKVGSVNSGLVNNVEYHLIYNFFSITAGDFDGDHKDDLAFYYPDTSNGAKMVVMTNLTKSGDSWNGTEHTDSSWVHPYASDPSSGSDEVFRYTSGSLAAGDFNGDGIDDLAIVTGHGMEYSYLWWGYKTAYGWEGLRYIPYMATILGKEGFTSTKPLDASYMFSSSEHIDSSYGHREATRYYGTFYSPSVAAGDVDGDGRDEVVLVGYDNVVDYLDEHNSGYIRCQAKVLNTNDGQDQFRVQITDVVTESRTQGNTVVKTDKVSRNNSQTINTNAWTRGGTWFPGSSDREYATSLPAVAMVALDGTGKKEKVFINGTLYEVSGSGSDAALNTANAYTPEFFENDCDFVGSTSITDMFINSLAVGNFNGNKYNCEQIVLSVALKTSGSNYFRFANIAIGGKDYDESQSNGYFSTKYSVIKDELNPSGLDASSGKALNRVLVAADIDKDGTLARYNSVTWTYSDPKVMAVLQAGPYFDDLADYYQGSSEVGYQVTDTYEFSKSSGNSVSFGVGVAVTLEGTVGGIEMSAGYALDWSEEFEETLTESYSTEFNAAGMDAVAMQRTSVFIYMYDEYDPEKNEWLENNLAISIPKSSVNTMLTIEEYNEFAEYYNKLVKNSENKLATIDPAAKYLGHAGDPTGYIQREEGGGFYTPLGDKEAAMSYTDGSIGISIEKGKATSVSESMDHGFSFEITAQFGFDAGFVESKAGPYASLEYMHTSSTTKTEGQSTTITGTIANPSMALALGDGKSRELLNSYGFNWQVATWDSGVSQVVTPEKDGNPAEIYNVPVIGFVLNSTHCPQGPINDLDIEVKGDNIALTWGRPTRSFANMDFTYNVYCNGELVNTTPLTEQKANLSVVDFDISHGNILEFKVTSIGSDGIESAYSNPVEFAFGLKQSVTDSPIEFRVNMNTQMIQWHFLGDTGWNDLIALSELQGEQGVPGKKVEFEASEGYVKYRYEGDANWTNIIAISDLTGKNGSDGKDGREVELRAENGVVQWHYTSGNDTEWHDLLTVGNQGVSIGIDGKDGREVELQVNNDIIQWRYMTGPDTEWHDLIKKSELTGEDGKETELRVEGDNIEWRYIGDANWTTLIPLSELKGEKGDAGKNISLRCNGGYLQWQQEGESTWTNLVPLSELQGPIGEKGDTGDDGRDLELRYDDTTRKLQWRYIGETDSDWRDLLEIDPANVSIAREIELRNNGVALEWRYEGETTWTEIAKLTDITGVDGQDGQDGVGIESISKVSSEGNVDTYQIKYTDGSTQSFTVTNGKDGKSGTNGTNGTNGKNGTAGKDGTDGQSGTVEVIRTQRYTSNVPGDNNTSVGTNIPTGNNGADGSNGIDGQVGKDGIDGKDGADGKDGKDGVGISDIQLNENGDFIFTLSDGSTKNAGNISNVNGFSQATPSSSDSASNPVAWVALALSGLAFAMSTINIFKGRKV